jgi:lysophospholipase L1-like esterase
LGLRLVDMTCSGSTSAHILDGGQLMLGPQLAAVGPQTRLVTITTGGNDVDYIGDLMAASGSMGGLVGWLNGPVRRAADRPYAQLTANLKRIVRQVRIKAPKAKIVLVSYPAIFPAKGNCPATGVGDVQAQISRDVAERLAQATRKAANEAGSVLVDTAALSTAHDVCSQSPWVNGAAPDDGIAFHPNAAGSAAMATGVIAAFGR